VIETDGLLIVMPNMKYQLDEKAGSGSVSVSVFDSVSVGKVQLLKLRWLKNCFFSLILREEVSFYTIITKLV
jgi:hypothetical protein